MFTLNQLETFIRVADTGSFNRAAEELFISPTGIMKQINALETEVGAVLLERTHRGQFLTKIGEEFYHDAKAIIEMCEKTSDKARNAEIKKQNTIRIGTSRMTPMEIFDELWVEIKKKNPELNLEVVPFENTPNEEGNIMPDPGKLFDIVPGSFDEVSLKNTGYNGLEIFESELCAILSINHPLADRETLEPEDLNQYLIMGRRGYMDDFREYMKYEQKAIVREIASYTTDIYNECANSNDILIGMGSLTKIHPYLKRIPIKWGSKVSYGLLYANNPPENVQKFIRIVEEIVNGN